VVPAASDLGEYVAESDVRNVGLAVLVGDAVARVVEAVAQLAGAGFDVAQATAERARHAIAQAGLACANADRRGVGAVARLRDVVGQVRAANRGVATVVGTHVGVVAISSRRPRETDRCAAHDRLAGIAHGTRVAVAARALVVGMLTDADLGAASIASTSVFIVAIQLHMRTLVDCAVAQIRGASIVVGAGHVVGLAVAIVVDAVTFLGLGRSGAFTQRRLQIETFDYAAHAGSDAARLADARWLAVRRVEPREVFVALAVAVVIFGIATLDLGRLDVDTQERPIGQTLRFAKAFADEREARPAVAALARHLAIAVGRAGRRAAQAEVGFFRAGRRGRQVVNFAIAIIILRVAGLDRRDFGTARRQPCRHAAA